MGSTVNFMPTAFVTACNVDKRVAPRDDKARFKDSRGTPAATATLVTPPRASAIRLRAIRRTPGSSSSSIAALRYSAAKAGSRRNMFITTSSCETLAENLIFFICKRLPCLTHTSSPNFSHTRNRPVVSPFFHYNPPHKFPIPEHSEPHDVERRRTRRRATQKEIPPG